MNVITDIMGNAKDGTLVIASKFACLPRKC